MKLILSITTLLLFTSNLTFSLEEGETIDPVLASFKEQLETELKEFASSSDIIIPDGYQGGSLILKYQTRTYMVHKRSKGAILSELEEREGPDTKGILLSVGVQKKGWINQAWTPQISQQPYWQTYLNVYPVADTEKQLYLALSYRPRTNEAWIEKIKGVAEGMTGDPEFPQIEARRSRHQLEGKLQVHPKYLYKYFITDFGDGQECALSRMEAQLKSIEPGSLIRVQGRLEIRSHDGGNAQNPSPFPASHYINMHLESVEVIEAPEEVEVVEASSGGSSQPD